MNILIQQLLGILLLVASLSVFIKIKYLGGIHDYFLSRRNKNIENGGKIKSLQQKFFAGLGLLLSTLLLLSSITISLPNLIMGSLNGLSAEEYRYLNAENKNENIDSLIKEYKEFKGRGFEDPKTYLDAKKLGVNNIVDYKKYKEDEAARNIEAKNSC